MKVLSIIVLLLGLGLYSGSVYSLFLDDFFSSAQSNCNTRAINPAEGEMAALTSILNGEGSGLETYFEHLGEQK